MRYSSLQLVQYTVPEVFFQTNKNFDPSKDLEVVEGAFRADYFLRKGDQTSSPSSVETEERDFWNVELQVAQTVDEGTNFPYRFKITVVGFFRFHDDAAKSGVAEKLVSVNGSTILYGIVRDLLVGLTAKAPWAPLMLPTIVFEYDESSNALV